MRRIILKKDKEDKYMLTFDKNLKDSLQFIASILVLISGVVIIFLSLYIEPIGIIHPSVISVFGMFLSFVGAVWNIDLKYNFKMKELEATLRDEKKGSDTTGE